MRVLKHLFEQNTAWAQQIRDRDPGFFTKLARQQAPHYLWIGCADSRVPANQIVGMMPGEMFVHRNVANVVGHTDMNCLSVLQYGIDVLKVKHVIVCGHYECGGVGAALRREKHGLVDNWLRHVRDIHRKHRTLLGSCRDESEQWDRLCELNVIEQVFNACQTTVVQDAWERGQGLAVHGWIFSLHTGLLRDLDITITHRDEIKSAYEKAVAETAGEP